MAIEKVSSFDDWYIQRRINERDGSLDARGFSKAASSLYSLYETAQREMDQRVASYYKLEMLADGQVISPKPDLPNISSGETAGIIRRMARNLVQNTPNVEVLSGFDDDSVPGIFSRHILTTKIIGSDQYSNDMQQNLFASTKTALTLGFDTVIPALLQDAGGGWYVKYDTIHYRDVFPEPGAKDVRQAEYVFVRRYLTRGEVQALVRDQTAGWDIPALQSMLNSTPYGRSRESVDFQSKKFGLVPEGYEIVTWYSSSGDPFLTFSSHTKLLLRIEKNKHPMKLHPVHFLVLEKDSLQPLGKSQVELLIGRQDFQDLMLNGAMKLWYRNINPSIIGFGTTNAVPNLSPGKYTQIGNPNARLEPFEVNTQTLLQYGQISQQNMGSMINLVGSADQQMATQAGNGGMSSTPQGVEAQEKLVDITTNNYQKAIESFFSHYCSYALTIYFQELKAVKKIKPSADARVKLLRSGLPTELVNRDGTIDVSFEKLAVEYFVRVVPGSLVEMEDEKQIRILRELFVPLSQAMPAIASSGDPDALKQATKTMQYVVGKMIELSGAASAKDLGMTFRGDVEEVDERDKKIMSLEDGMHTVETGVGDLLGMNATAMRQMQEQIALLMQSQEVILQKLGAPAPAIEAPADVSPASAPSNGRARPILSPSAPEPSGMNR
jgi:hypothetical protein